MKAFDEAYNASRRETVMENSRRIEREHAQVVSAVKRIYGIDDFHSVNESDKCYYRDIINHVWNPKSGINEYGRRLVNESVVPILEGCSDMDIEKRFRREVKKNIRSICSCACSENGECTIVSNIVAAIKKECGRKIKSSVAKEIICDEASKFVKSKIKF